MIEATKLHTRTLSIAIFCALGGCSDTTGAQQQTRLNESIPTAAPREGQRTVAALPDFTPLIAEYGDSVVNVEVMQQRTQTAGRMMPDDPMTDFFRRFGLPVPETGPQGPRLPMRGAGSGFIVSPDGYILTNAHVVADAETVTVRLTDRREFKAKVIGSDARSDVAVIKIEARDLPSVRIGNPEQLKTGQWVLAIGSPFGLENTATAGIVSATSRTVGGDSYVPFIQTDVAVNPGNSGGPLFNLQGEVVGINSMIFSRTGGYMGLSFAIPIDVAMNVRDQLVKSGRVVRGRIGVTVQDVDASLANAFGLDRPRGALVSSVEDGGPADKGGVQPGDVITAVGDEEVDRYSRLSGLIADMKPGTSTTLEVWRNGKPRKLPVRVAEMQEQMAANVGGDESSKAAQLGMAVRPLSSAEKRQADTQGNLVVEQVTGAAATAGVQRGDIVLGVNGKSIESVEQLRDAVKGARNNVAVLIERGDAQIFVPIPVAG
jgi:serine protease Do